ncbi:hypothetical protein Cgig2_021622 [Carnegiea gigantea]|uniref:Uncharacterized protein n=1 Tax=Carnegiea gigantea TaxID=171969 RepID=A0A9Q1GQW3_9CARY|nr:hypothetical protein Cgig2_021622 [Carnegiea gigantea]
MLLLDSDGSGCPRTLHGCGFDRPRTLHSGGSAQKKRDKGTVVPNLWIPARSPFGFWGEEKTGTVVPLSTKRPYLKKSKWIQIPKMVKDVGKKVDGEDHEKMVGGIGDKELVEMDDGNFHSSPQNGNIDLVRNVKSHPFDERFSEAEFQASSNSSSKIIFVPIANIEYHPIYFEKFTSQKICSSSFEIKSSINDLIAAMMNTKVLEKKDMKKEFEGKVIEVLSKNAQHYLIT